MAIVPGYVHAEGGDDPRIPVLVQPVACQIGVTCFIQAYVDSDPKLLQARDYRCGRATIDGHNGTDFRLLNVLSVDRKVAVLAADAGVVTTVTTDMGDQLARPLRPAFVAGAACGNAIVLDHGSGWETHYCHLRAGSVGVMPGDRVQRGQRIGDIGFSGNASFPHLHFIVRHQGKIIDPFSGLTPDGTCQQTHVPLAGPRLSLWQPKAEQAMPYVDGQILEAGFADDPVGAVKLERGIVVTRPRGLSGALYLYARVSNLHAGDRVAFDMAGPENLKFEVVSEPAPRDQPIAVVSATHRRPGWSWRLGRYRGSTALKRGEQVLSTAQFELDMK